MGFRVNLGELQVNFGKVAHFAELCYSWEITRLRVNLVNLDCQKGGEVNLREVSHAQILPYPKLRVEVHPSSTEIEITVCYYRNIQQLYGRGVSSPQVHLKFTRRGLKFTLLGSKFTPQ